MKIFLPAMVLLLALVSCSTNKNYHARRNEDKTLFSIIKQLNKKPSDEQATAALPDVYAQLQQTHLANVASYSTSSALSRWEQINNEYSILQDMYNAIVNSSAASNLVTAVSYQKQIDSTRRSAAEEYFQLAMSHYNHNNWSDARKAYSSFKKANEWASGYKNSHLLMDSAYQRSIVTILINPVQDNSYFFNSGWSNNGFDLSSGNFSQKLVTDLGGKSSRRYPARFYANSLTQREIINPDWIVDLTLKEVQLPTPTIYNYTRKVNAKVEDGKDSTGKVVYKTVHATMHIQRRSFTATAQMEVNGTDAYNKKNLFFDNLSESYNWQQEVASYSGDSRALSNRDWELVNNRYQEPSPLQVIQELYRGLYPQVKSRLARAVDF